MIDHIGYFKQFNELGIDVYCNQKTANKLQQGSHRKLSNINIIENKKAYNVGAFSFVPFPLVHSSHEVNESGTTVTVPCECTGFLISDNETLEKMLWITDTMYVENRFPPVNYICVECNYFEVDDYNQEIEHIKSTFVEKRRIGSHMSFETCMEFINSQDLSKCKQIRLLHLSSSLTAKQKEYIRNKAIKAISKKDVEVII